MTISLKRSPSTSDGRTISLTTRFRGDVDPYFTGCGDDPSVLPGASGRRGGADFLVGWSTSPGSADDKNLEFQFNDWVYISGGRIQWTGGNAGDYVSFKMYAPATIVTSNAGSGNCNLSPLGGGANLVVPADGDGSHDVTDVDKIPVPAFDGNGNPNGYWNWDEPDEGRGSVSPSAVPGKGNCNLLDFDRDLVVWVARLQLIGDGSEPISPETTARKIYPPWKFRVDIHNAGASTLHCAWTMYLARKVTT